VSLRYEVAARIGDGAIAIDLSSIDAVAELDLSADVLINNAGLSAPVLGRENSTLNG
jgi:hypothetical protein